MSHNVELVSPAILEAQGAWLNMLKVPIGQQKMRMQLLILFFLKGNPSGKTILCSFEIAHPLKQLLIILLCSSGKPGVMSCLSLFGTLSFISCPVRVSIS